MSRKVLHPRATMFTNRTRNLMGTKLQGVSNVWVWMFIIRSTHFIAAKCGKPNGQKSSSYYSGASFLPYLKLMSEASGHSLQPLT